MYLTLQEVLPINNRLFRSGSKEPQTLPEPAAKSARRKQWAAENMERALRDVTNGSLTVRRAALEYNVPNQLYMTA